MSDLVTLIRERIGSEFDGECHLTEAEAEAIASRISQQDAELEQYRTAFRAIIERSHNDPLGTSKVVDMRRIAEAALGEKP